MNQQKHIADYKRMAEIGPAPGQKPEVTQIIPSVRDVFHKQPHFLAAESLARRKSTFPYRFESLLLKVVAPGNHRNGDHLMLRRQPSEFTGNVSSSPVLTVAVGQK